ncbi:MAG: transporter [Solirubrobacterales bacterium]
MAQVIGRRGSHRLVSSSAPKTRVPTIACRTRPHGFLQALVLCITLQLAAAAEAADQPPDDYINPDRPGLADGSNVVGAGRIQIETGIQQEYRSTDGNRSRTLFVPTLLRMGLDNNFELRIESNTYTRMTDTDSTQRAEGVAPASLGFKYHFIDSLGWKHPAVGAIVRFFPRSGTGNFKTTRATGDFRIVADWDFLPQWSLNPNVGVALYESEDSRLYAAGLFAATLNYNPSKNVNFFIDTGLQSPETKHGQAAVLVDFGAAYVIGRDVQLDFSAGSRVAGKTPPRLFLSAGISKRF